MKCKINFFKIEKTALRFIFFFFLMILYFTESKKMMKNIKCKNLKHCKKSFQYNDISINPKYTFSNDSNDRFNPKLSYHLVHEDNTSRPIIRYPYQDPLAVVIKSNNSNSLNQN